MQVQGGVSMLGAEEDIPGKFASMVIHCRIEHIRSSRTYFVRYISVEFIRCNICQMYISAKCIRYSSAINLPAIRCGSDEIITCRRIEYVADLSLSDVREINM